jgi:subtilisin-like proprotein convertase family protein
MRVRHALLFLYLIMLSSAASAQVTTFCNTGSITINDNAVASVYPSAIAVSGQPVKLTSLTVTINGFSHQAAGDVGMVLVGPGGQAFLIQDDAGGASAVSNVNYTLSDSAAVSLPQNTAWAAGTYKPSAYFSGDSFASPGPGTTYSSPATAGTSTFNTIYLDTNPNGTWNLYVADFAAGNTGAIAGGWCVSISATLPVRLQSFSVD